MQISPPIYTTGQAGPFAVNALDVKHLGFRYASRQALDNVSFSLAPGEIVVLLGPNGGGKSTLFFIISGLFAPLSGSVNIAGVDLQVKGSRAHAPLGIVFQAQTLDLDLSVKQNLMYFCALHGMDKQLASQRINVSLKRLQMLDRLDDKIRSLNGGHRRRVEIARATLHEPSILLLDEPTVGLDIPTRRALIGHLHELPKAAVSALLWATHLVDEVLENDRVIMLHGGVIVADGKPANLIALANVDTLEQAFDAFTGNGRTGDGNG